MRQLAPEASLTPEQAAVADQGVKTMIPVTRERPLLDFILASLADAGIAKVVIVIGPEHEPLRSRYQHLPLHRITVSFAVQAEARGTADAVLAVEALVGADSFLVVNSDNLYPVAALRMLCGLNGPGLIGYDRECLVRESNIPADRIARFAVIWADRDGYLTRIVEKPDPQVLVQSTMVSMNSWRFSSRIFEACRGIAPSPRGEFELQDAVTYAIDQLGERFTVIPARGGVLDLSSRADIAAVAARLEHLEISL
jgi:glucose-1-phosphate thymidylyltransferase